MTKRKFGQDSTAPSETYSSTPSHEGPTSAAPSYIPVSKRARQISSPLLPADVQQPADHGTEDAEDGTNIGPSRPTSPVQLDAQEPEIEDQGPSESCTHTLHPTYSDTYQLLSCPACRMEDCILNLVQIERVIMDHGGSQQWLEHIQLDLSGSKKNEQINEYHFWKGTTKRNRFDGSLSHTRCRSKLLDLVADMKTLRQGEQIWEKNNPVHALDEETRNHLARSCNSSARRAIAHYHNAVQNNEIGAVVMDSAEFSRKRGREWEAVAELDFPDPQNPYESSSAFTVMAHQEDLVRSRMAVGDDVESYQERLDVNPRKRKRRRPDANVEFDEHIYVRTDRDVDILFKPTPDLTPDFLEDTEYDAPAPKSILRTAPRHMYPGPWRAHEVYELETEEKNTAKTSKWVRSGPSDGYELIDTSGWRKNWDTWDAYSISHEELDMRVPGHGEIEQPDEGAVEDEVPPAEEADPQGQQVLGPEGQIWKEVHEQGKRIAELENEAAPLEVIPGGMVSAFFVGAMVGGRLVDMVYRYGMLPL